MPDPEVTEQAGEPAEPNPAFWASLGLTGGVELQAGHQSRVFRVSIDGEPLVAKLTDRALADPQHRRRVELLCRLAAAEPAVVGPVSIGPEPVLASGGWSVTCYPMIDGAPPDASDRSDVEAMAVTLARLHVAMASLGTNDLPPVAALRSVTEQSGQPPILLDRWIHGDYAAANLIATSTGLRVIDFDDSGRGSAAFELGNSLYMVLFDGWLHDDPALYRRFRAWFLEAYRAEASWPVDEATVERAIGLRVQALRTWLGDPERAPIGIRTSSPQWRQRLWTFVELHSELHSEDCGAGSGDGKD